MKKASAVLILLCLCVNVFSWSDLTVKYMVVQAYPSFPEGLRLFLDGNRRDLMRGLGSVSADHFENLKQLENFVCSQERKIEKMIKSREKVSEIAFEFGKLFKAIAIASYPFHFEKSSYSRDYSQYVESKLEKYPFAFKRITVNDLSKQNCNSLVKSIYRESGEFKEKIMNDYKIYETSENFDDLSASFGAGSLMFSKTCMAIASLSSKIWKKANGSLKGACIFKDN